MGRENEKEGGQEGKGKKGNGGKLSSTRNRSLAAPLHEPRNLLSSGQLFPVCS